MACWSAQPIRLSQSMHVCSNVKSGCGSLTVWPHLKVISVVSPRHMTLCRRISIQCSESGNPVSHHPVLAISRHTCMLAHGLLFPLPKMVAIVIHVKCLSDKFLSGVSFLIRSQVKMRPVRDNGAHGKLPSLHSNRLRLRAELNFD